MPMNRKIYQCRVCGGLVAVLQPGAGGFSCCGAPLTFFEESPPQALREAPAPLIDLIEVVVDGKARWQSPSARKAAPAGAR